MLCSLFRIFHFFRFLSCRRHQSEDSCFVFRVVCVCTAIIDYKVASAGFRIKSVVLLFNLVKREREKNESYFLECELVL
jgi:hypothetical protein